MTITEAELKFGICCHHCGKLFDSKSSYPETRELIGVHSEAEHTGAWLKDEVFTTLGIVGGCWENIQCAGKFRSETARAAGEALMDKINHYTAKHDDQTMFKVYVALEKAGLTEHQRATVVAILADNNICFREPM